MKTQTRRTFLKALGLSGLALQASSFINKEDAPLLSFSTLGCPDWSFDKILDFAITHQYNGIEIRGIQRELDLTKTPQFDTDEHISNTKKLIADKGLKIVDLGSSAALHLKEGSERQKNLDEAKRFIDLANKINCPYVRVFPNNLPKDKKQETMELIAKGLKDLAGYAKGGNVTVLMETHGELTKVADIEKVMQMAADKHNGLVWDIVNMWSVTKEDPSLVYEKLKKYIHHTHIKDLKMVDGKEEYTLLGRGEAPVFKAIDILRKNGYKGYYSFEWEKLWHPEIPEPEIALADYPVAMKAHFKNY